jgi:hypothetical protein
MVVDERLEPEEQAQVLHAEEVGGSAEVPIDQLVENELIVAPSFPQVALKALEAPGLDALQLIPHGCHVGGKRELAAVVEDEAVRWINLTKLEPLV